MATLDELIEFVKEQVAFHSERASHFSANNFRRTKHLETAAKLVDVQSFIESARDKSKPPEQLSFALTAADIEGLPDELMRELSVSSGDKAEFAILNLITEAGGTLSLDQILVKYYRLTGEIVKRTAMTNRLYRMVQKGMLFGFPGKKGVYSTTEYAGSTQETEDRTDLDFLN